MLKSRLRDSDIYYLWLFFESELFKFIFKMAAEKRTVAIIQCTSLILRLFWLQCIKNFKCHENPLARKRIIYNFASKHFFYLVPLSLTIYDNLKFRPEYVLFRCTLPNTVSEGIGIILNLMIISPEGISDPLLCN